VRAQELTSSKALKRTGWSYFGLIAGLPPGVPGGGIIGIVAPEGGGVCFIPGPTSAGGITTPPERLRSELVVPLAGGYSRGRRLDRRPNSRGATQPPLRWRRNQERPLQGSHLAHSCPPGFLLVCGNTSIGSPAH